MFDLNNYTFFLLAFVGAVLITATLPLVESAIPPTPSLKCVVVQTSNWFLNDTTVCSTVYDDTWQYVTDGSITFNVTDSLP